MKLAERLKKGTYRLPSIPKPAPPETEVQKQKRLLEQAKRKFRELLNRSLREHKKDLADSPWKRERGLWKFDFLDVPVDWFDFDSIFESYSDGRTWEYKLKKDTWFYKFLLWLQNEGFSLSSIKKHESFAWDRDDRYDFRVHW